MIKLNFWFLVQNEITEREDFLTKMEKFGQSSEHKNRIDSEISQVCVCVCVFVCMYVCLCVCVCVFVCMCVYLCA